MNTKFLTIPLALAIIGTGCQAPAPGTTQPVSDRVQTYTDNSFGFSFSYPTEWKLDTSDGIVFRNLGPYKTENEGDILSVRRMEGSSVKVQDAKFGDTTLYFDENQNQWMVTQPDPAGSSDYTTVRAVPVYTTPSGLPVFNSTGRWKTVIIPLSHKRFLVVNMTGGGWTSGLDPFVKTLREPDDTVKAEDLEIAVTSMLDSEKQ